MVKRFYVKLTLFFLIACVFVSCAKERTAQFPLGFAVEDKLFASGRAAREGTLDFSKTKKLEYRFDSSFFVPSNSSFVIEYDFSIPVSQAIREKNSLVLKTGTVSWELPMDINCVQYAIPIDDFPGGNFSIVLESSGRIDKNNAPVFQIHFMRFTERWFGFSVNTDEFPLYSPFLNRRDNGSYVIDVPEYFLPNPSFAEFDIFVSSQRGALEFAGRKFETLPGRGVIYIPPVLYPSAGQAILSGEGIEKFFLTAHSEPVIFPEPIEADPALVLAFPKEKWRNSEYEIFRWEQFPSLLIFDFADYDAQDRMLKRLAFFVEKAGFRGRLAPDAEIADLHGWNAHDYKADDLARFFDLARRTNFPLLGEERQLEKILLDRKIIREDASDTSSGIIAGHGGIISVSRESPDYLRRQLMAHEGFHGIFFLDEEFRNFSKRRWERLSAPAKRFLISFFEFQQYDTKDENLGINEFMAHVLQQPVSQAAGYFGQTLPLRLETTWRAGSLPKKDESSGTWPVLAAAFASEAAAFSNYVNQRWGLAAGRVWGLKID